jgi:hypothetical protein
MEASTLSPQADTPEERTEIRAVAEVSVAEIFEWSGDVHVGRGADECDWQAGCQTPGHFHAWMCLANAFQIRDIGDKARAAKARKIRALKDAGNGDPEKASDSYVTLEAMLDERRQEMGAVIAEVVQNSVSKQLGLIYKELNEEEEFENASQDSEEFARQAALPEEERDPEEYAELQKSQEKFAQALQDRVERRTDAERQSLEAMSEDEVIDLLRTKLINEEATQAYLNTYYTWLMFVGTRDIVDHAKRKFAALPELKNAAPEIVSALRKMMEKLENKVDESGGGQGNS